VRLGRVIIATANMDRDRTSIASSTHDTGANCKMIPQRQAMLGIIKDCYLLGCRSISVTTPCATTIHSFRKFIHRRHACDDIRKKKQSISIIVVAAADFRIAQADFMAYTVPPVPTDSIPKFTDAAEVILKSLFPHTSVN
jgi:hypothetical protein